MLENNKLPKDWKLVKIMDVSDINPKLPNRDDIDKEIEVQFLPMKLVEATINKIHLTETKKIIDAMKGSYTPFIDNDIVFAKVTPCMENGKIAVVNNLKNGIGFGSSEFHVLRSKKEVLNKYLFHYIIQESFRNKAANEMTGAVGLRRVPKKFIENSLIPIPSIKIQSSIISKIEELFSELDKGIEDLKTAQQQLKIYRQSVLKWAFEGKLKNKEIKDGELPKGWEIVMISDIANVSTGTTPSKSNSDYYGTDYPFYKPTDLEAGNNVFESKDGLTELGLKQARYVPEFSTLVTCIGATIGKTGYIRNGGGFNQQINAIVPKKGINPLFLYYQSLGKDFNKQIIANASATTLPIINKSKFQALKMSICNLQEQDKIVQEIEIRLSVADKMEESISQSLQQAEALRQSILKKAFSGELV